MSAKKQLILESTFSIPAMKWQLSSEIMCTTDKEIFLTIDYVFQKPFHILPGLFLSKAGIAG